MEVGTVLDAIALVDLRGYSLFVELFFHLGVLLEIPVVSEHLLDRVAIVRATVSEVLSHPYRLQVGQPEEDDGQEDDDQPEDRHKQPENRREFCPPEELQDVMGDGPEKEEVEKNK